MFTFLAEVFEEFLAVDELPALGLGYSAIDFLADSSAEMGLVPVALNEGVESLGDNGPQRFQTPQFALFSLTSFSSSGLSVIFIKRRTPPLRSGL